MFVVPQLFGHARFVAPIGRDEKDRLLEQSARTAIAVLFSFELVPKIAFEVIDVAAEAEGRPKISLPPMPASTKRGSSL